MDTKTRSFRILQAALLLAATCAIIVSDLIPGAFPSWLVTLAYYLGSLGLLVAVFAFGFIWKIGADPVGQSGSAPDMKGVDRFLPPKL